MPSNRAHPVLQHAAAAVSRRASLAMLSGAVLAATMPGLSPVKAKKKGKRKRNCKKTNPSEQIPTCAEQCFPEFPLCFTRTEGPPLCANGAFTDGTTPCATDQDCLGDASKPYCLVSVTTEVTGTTDRFTTCEPYADGCCISVIA